MYQLISIDSMAAAHAHFTKAKSCKQPLEFAKRYDAAGPAACQNSCKSWHNPRPAVAAIPIFDMAGLPGPVKATNPLRGGRWNAYIPGTFLSSLMTSRASLSQGRAE